MLRAVLFDFDGLILDTEMPEVQTYREIYADHGHEFPDEVWMKMIGISSPENSQLPWRVLEERTGAIDRNALVERSRARRIELIEAQSLQPGVLEVLEECDLRGIRKAIVSSSGRKWVEGHLGRLGILERFERCVCGHEGLPSKPAPDLYKKACAEMGVAPTEALAIEDSPNGIAAAVAAGLFTLAVPNALTARLDISQANLKMDSLLDVDWVDLLSNF